MFYICAQSNAEHRIRASSQGSHLLGITMLSRGEMSLGRAWQLPVIYYQPGSVYTC